MDSAKIAETISEAVAGSPVAGQVLPEKDLDIAIPESKPVVSEPVAQDIPAEQIAVEPVITEDTKVKKRLYENGTQDLDWRASKDAPPVIKMENPNYIGTNTKDPDFVPFPINVYGEEFMSKTLDPAEMAKEIATRYNGRPTDEYVGFYRLGRQDANYDYTNWVQDFANAAAGIVAGAATKAPAYAITAPNQAAIELRAMIPEALDYKNIYTNLMSDEERSQIDSMDGVIGKSRINSFYGMTPEQKKVFSDWKVNNKDKLDVEVERQTALAKINADADSQINLNILQGATSISDWLSNKARWASGSYNKLDNPKFGGQVSRGLGSVIPSIALGFLGGSAAAGAVYGGISATEIILASAETGIPLNDAFARGAAGGLLIGASEGIAGPYTLYKAAVKNVTKREFGKNIVGEALGLIEGESLDAMKKKAVRTGLTYAAEGALVNAGQERFQNATQEYLSSNMDTNDALNMFMSFDNGNLASDVVSLLLGVAGASSLGWKASKTAAAAYDDRQEAVKAFKAKLGEFNKEGATLLGGIEARLNKMFGDDKQLTATYMNAIINQDPETINAIISKVADSTVASIDPDKLAEYNARLDSIRASGKDISKSAFDALDQRVQAALNDKSAKSYSEQDKLLIRGIMRGLAQFQVYVNGVMPEDFIIPSFTARAGSGAAGVFRRKIKAGNIDSLEIGIKKDLATESGAGKLHDDFAKVDDKFDKALWDTDISQRVHTILHELAGHYGDFILGTKAKGNTAGDFAAAMSYYFDGINKIFGGTEKFSGSMNVEGREKSWSDKRQRKWNGRTTEMYAESIATLGKDAMDYIGLKGDPANFVAFANALVSGIQNFTKMSDEIAEYQSAMQELITKNSGMIKDILDAKGAKVINAVVESTAADTPIVSEDVSYDDIKDLWEAVSGKLVNGDALKAIAKAGDGQPAVNWEAFAQQGRDWFLEGVGNKPVSNPHANQIVVDSPFDTDAMDLDRVLTEESPLGFEVSDGVEEAITKKRGDLIVGSVIGGTKLTDDLINANNQFENKKPLSGIYKWLLKSASFFGIDDFMYAIGGKWMQSKFDLVAKYSDFQDNVIKYNDKLYDKIKSKLGINSLQLTDLQQKMALKDKTVKIHNLFQKNPFDTEDSIKDMEVSDFELMSIYIHSKNDINKARMQKTLAEPIDEVVARITPEVKAYGDALMEYMKDLLPDFKKMLKAKDPDAMISQLQRNGNWFPVLDLMHAVQGETKVRSMYERDKDSESAIAIFDAQEIANSYFISLASRGSEFYSQLNRFNDMLFAWQDDYLDVGIENIDEKREIQSLSRNFHNDTEQRIGKPAMANLKLLLDDLLKESPSNVLGKTYGNMIAHNAVSAMLMFRPIQFIKNTSNFFLYWGLANDQTKYWSDTVDGIAHASETVKLMLDIPAVRNRLKGNVNEIVNQLTTGGDNVLAQAMKDHPEWFNKSSDKIGNSLRRFISLSTYAKKAGFSPMLYGDAFANIFGGYGYYKSLLDSGMSAEEAKRQFGIDVVKRQSNNNQALRSLTQRQYNRTPFNSMMIAFTSELMQKWRTLVSNAEQTRQGDMSTGEMLKDSGALLSASLVFALISADILDLFDDDDDNDKMVHDALIQEGVQFATGGTIWSNAIIAPFALSIIGQSRGGMQMPLLSEFYKVKKEIVNGEYDEVMAQMLSMSGILVGSPNLLGVAKGVKQTATGETDKQTDAGIRRALGRTKNFAYTREGLKEKEEPKDKKDVKNFRRRWEKID